MKNGFTLIEILIVLTIIGILAGIMIRVIDLDAIFFESRTAAAEASLLSIKKAAIIYANEEGQWAADVNRGLPPEFINSLSPDSLQVGPYTGSVFDWDNWENRTCWDGSTGNIQVSLREIPDYEGKSDYVLYYVIQGPGIPHCNNSSTKGICLNCPSRYP